MNIGSPITQPDHRALLNGHLAEVFSSLNCHEVGELVSFDDATQTASVKLMVQRVVFNQPQTVDDGLQQTPMIVDYPLLVDVPVFIYSGGTASFRMPFAAGDPCLVLFNDRDIDAWFATGTKLPPNSPRMHSLADGLALVGFRNKANALPSYVSTETALVNNGARIAALNDGTVEITTANASVKLKSDGTVEIKSTALGSTLNLQAKVGVSNGSGSLLGALDALATLLTNFKDTHGDTPDATTLLAITAFKTQVDALLQ